MIFKGHVIRLSSFLKLFKSPAIFSIKNTISYCSLFVFENVLREYYLVGHSGIISSRNATRNSRSRQYCGKLFSTFREESCRYIWSKTFMSLASKECFEEHSAYGHEIAD